MSGPSAPQSWHTQHPSHAATRLHNGVAPYRDTRFMNTTGLPSTNYESSNGQARVVPFRPGCIAPPLSLTQSTFIPRRDPARNQRPGSPFFCPIHPAQIDGSQVQSRLHRGSQRAAYPYGSLRVAPGGIPYGHQKPGMITVSPRHGNHYQNRSGAPYFPHLLRKQEDAGHQREDLHSKTIHQWPGMPVPSTTGDLGLHFDWESGAIAPPQYSQINEPMLIGSATVLVPETTPPGVFLGTQPAGAPTLGTEAPSPEVSQSTTGTCPDPTCKTICGRQQEWERHVLKHLPQHIYCPHPSCNWRGSRRYSLMDHYNKKHQHPQSQVPDLGSSDAFTIYDGKRLVKRLVNREVTLKEAIDEADASVRRMAVELGKWVMWNIQYE